MNSTPQTASDQIADYRWLVSPEAEKWLAEADKLVQDSGAKGLVRLTEQLRQSLAPGQVHLVLQQIELREKGREKFPNSQRMFFTPQGLEQATDAWIADYKAARFPRAGVAADLCCGIGGDALALARRGPLRAVERNPITAILVAANLRNQSTAEVITSDVREIALGNSAAWHIDPDRRPEGRRTTKVALHEPGPDVLARLLAACPDGAIKLAPAATFEEPWWAQAELEWISRARQCRQLVAWFGRLAQAPGRRRATVIRNSEGAESTVAASFVGEPEMPCGITRQIGQYIFEPDPAVLAAKLEGALAVDQQLSAVAEGVAYFTADRRADHPALACFEVMETMPYKMKEVRQWLAARDIGRLEIKKRGVELDPEDVRRQLNAKGDSEATLLLMRVDGRTTAVLARRVAISRS